MLCGPQCVKFLSKGGDISVTGSTEQVNSPTCVTRLQHSCRCVQADVRVFAGPGGCRHGGGHTGEGGGAAAGVPAGGNCLRPDA